MYRHTMLQRLSKHAFCLLLLIAGMPGSSTWADDADDTISEWEQRKIRKEREAEEAEIKAQFTYAFDDVCDNLVIIECKGEHGAWSGSGFIAAMDGKTYIFT
ncbi:MAG TPA: hypothetical protein VLL07_07030, partial [Pontiella sp.]|nr:hypothetical protein [Pontiella sp.]